MVDAAESPVESRRHSGAQIRRWMLCCSYKNCLSHNQKSIHTTGKHYASSSRDRLYFTNQAGSSPDFHDISIPNVDEIVVHEDQHSADISSLGQSTSIWQLTSKTKKRIFPLISLLPLQIFTNKHSKHRRGNVGGETDDFRTSNDVLNPPLINLIPPTPSDIISYDPFFESNSEEEITCVVGEHTSAEINCINTDEGENSKEENICSLNENVTQVTNDEERNVFDVSTENQRLCLNDENIEGMIEFVHKQSGAETFQVPTMPKFGTNKQNETEWYQRESVNSVCRFLPLEEHTNSLYMSQNPLKRRFSLGRTSLSSLKGRSPLGNKLLKKRRMTLASFLPVSTEKNNISDEKISHGDSESKHLCEMNTEEVCIWFVNLGLEKCVSAIKDANLQGCHISAIDQNVLNILQLNTTEEKEKLLSAVYKELHPSDAITECLDHFLESTEPVDITDITNALVSLTTEKNHQCKVTDITQSEAKDDCEKTENTQEKPDMVTVIVKAFEKKLQLKVPKETRISKIMDTCITIFGIEEKRTILFFRNGLINSSQELCEDRCIGELQNRAMRHITLHLQQKPVTHPAETTIQTNHMKDKILHLEEELKKKDEAIAKLERHLASMRIFHQQVLNIPGALQTWNSKMKIMCCKSCSPTTEAELQWVQSKVQEKTLIIDSIRKMKAERTSQRKSNENDEMIENLNLDYSIIEEEILLSNLKVQKRFLKECQTNWKEWKALEATQAAGGVVI